MVKNNLRENGFSEITQNPKQSKVNKLWVFLTVFFIIGTLSGVIFILEIILGGTGEPIEDTFIYIIETVGSTILKILTLGFFKHPILGYVILMILTLFLYLVLKLFMTILFCYKTSNIKMKFLENTGIPICFCREALKVWQTVMIYLAPFGLIYSFYIFLCIRYQAHPIIMVMFFFMLFFLAYDFTLVLYVLIIKIKERMDYISIDNHIYEITLYKKAYIKLNKKVKNKIIT